MTIYPASDFFSSMCKDTPTFPTFHAHPRCKTAAPRAPRIPLLPCRCWSRRFPRSVSQEFLPPPPELRAIFGMLPPIPTIGDRGGPWDIEGGFFQAVIGLVARCKGPLRFRRKTARKSGGLAIRFLDLKWIERERSVLAVRCDRQIGRKAGFWQLGGSYWSN